MMNGASDAPSKDDTPSQDEVVSIVCVLTGDAMAAKKRATPNVRRSEKLWNISFIVTRDKG